MKIFPEVSKVLANKSKMIKSIALRPGDLQLFKGRYSLHRVAPLKGVTPRYVAIFSYVEKDNMVKYRKNKTALWPSFTHTLEKEGLRSDNLMD